MSTYYYIYCDGILGVETNIADFKWIYGSVAPVATKQNYEKCVVKFVVNVMPEKQLKEYSADDCFQSYIWNSENHTISYRRSLLGNIKIGYNISMMGDKIVAEIGKSYYRFVRNRVMNLHGIYWLLSDLANMFLLYKGYLTLYASAVYYEPLNKGIVCFGSPNMGKTLTATSLCEKEEYSLVGEDIVIMQGNHLLACPWTASYRKKASCLDSAGALGRTTSKITNEVCENCDVTNLVVLTAKKEVSLDKACFLDKISILNGYLFNYCASPIVKILGYFDKTYCQDWNKYAIVYLEQMLNHCQYNFVYADNPIQYGSLIDDIVMGEMK